VCRHSEKSLNRSRSKSWISRDATSRKFIRSDAISKSAGALHEVKIGGFIRVDCDILCEGRADLTIEVSGAAPLSARDFFP